jgi:hypothetical protein
MPNKQRKNNDIKNPQNMCHGSRICKLTAALRVEKVRVDNIRNNPESGNDG